MGLHPFTIVFSGAIAIVGWFVGFQFGFPFALLIGAGTGVLVLLSIRVASQWKKAIVLRFGKFHRMCGPGFFGIIPFIDTIPYWIDQRTIATPFKAEQTLTKDSVPVDVDAVLFWRVLVPEKAALEVENYGEAVSWSAQTALRDVIGETDLSAMMVGRQQIDAKLREMIDHRTGAWGVKVLSVELRDVKIPTGLQDAMSKQAQAERERKSRVILAESEQQVAERFQVASQSYIDNPVALHLRAMNILLEGMRQNSTVVIVPSSCVETMGGLGVSGLTSIIKGTKPKPIT